jgi:hypothetical protein
MILDHRVVATYQYGHDGSVQQVHCIAMDQLPVGKDTGGMDYSVWTAWSRPMIDTVDKLYLARSDGVVQYCHIKKERDQVLPVFAGVVAIPHIIDKAFAAVSCELPHRTQSEGLNKCTAVHTVFVGGSGCYGAEYHVNPKAEELDLHRNSVLPNWAPLGDVTTASGGESYIFLLRRRQLDHHAWRLFRNCCTLLTAR